MSAAVHILNELVACPSVSPGHRRQFESPFGEARMAALLGRRLERCGAQVSLTEVYADRPNLVARIDGRDPERSIMFEAHSDTVQVDDMTIPPFTPTVSDGRLYGRGATDTKGSMAAMLCAIEQVIEEDGRPPVTLYFVSTCDEELGAAGARALMGSGFRPDMAIVGEPTDLKICRAHKGVLHWSITTHGCPAHSSTPDRGHNAIYDMVRIVAAVRETLMPKLQALQHAELGSPTLNVGTMTGGTQVNVVPASCRCEIDRRMLPGEDPDMLTSELTELVADVMQGSGMPAPEITTTTGYPPLETASDAPVSRLAADACREVLGTADFVTAPWASNAGIFHEAGVPSILFGPGSIHQAHTRNEFILVDELERAVDVYAAMIRMSGQA